MATTTCADCESGARTGIISGAKKVASTVQLTPVTEGAASINQLMEGAHQTMNTSTGGQGPPQSQSGCFRSHILKGGLHQVGANSGATARQNLNNIYAQ